MGYLPSAAGRGLKTRRSQALGVILSSIDDPFFSEVLQGIEDVSSRAGYSLFVAASHRDFECERAIVRAMGEGRVDGFIICSTSFKPEHAHQLGGYGLPFTIINNQAAEEYRYSIYHDDQWGSFLITRHLIELGHQKIAYLGNASAGRTSQDRLVGFQEAMRQTGISVPEEYVYQGPNGRADGGFDGAIYFLHLPHPPTAIICFNDMMAIGALRAIHQEGLRVPVDFSVTGFDNIAISAYVTPPLTTFHQPKYHLGEEAAGLMLRLLTKGDQEPGEPQIQMLRGELLVRDSTGPPGCNAENTQI
jgi:DNA-binding LacI/PurR family transcriptional regulator